MRFRFLLIIGQLAYMFFGASAQAQDITPKYSNEFLAIGVGARAFAMANSVITSSHDATSAYWNPASMVDIKDKYSLGFMHSIYFSGIANYDFAGFATKIDEVSALGVSALRFAIDDIPDTRFLYDANGAINYDNIKFFSSSDYAFFFSYSRKFEKLKMLQTGANFKVIYRNVGQFANAWGFGLDAGAILPVKNWRFGLMARDITTTFNAWSHNVSLIKETYALTDNDVPVNTIEITLPKAIFGVSYSQKVKTHFGFLVETNIISTFDGKRNTLVSSSISSLDFSIGAELNYKELVYLRGGTGNFQKIENFDNSTHIVQTPAFGLGIALKHIVVDYALSNIGNVAESPYSHVFSIEFRFDKLNQE